MKILKDIVFTILEKCVNMDIINSELQIGYNSKVQNANLRENLTGNLVRHTAVHRKPTTRVNYLYQGLRDKMNQIFYAKNPKYFPNYS